MAMLNFFEEYKNLLKIAFEEGINSISLKTKSVDNPFFDEKHQKKFLAACHRGYEKAQYKIVNLFYNLHQNKNIPKNKIQYKELLLRKVMDGIAVIILNMKSHIVHRFVLHNEAPKISIDTIKKTLKIVEMMNKESRKTFTLLADLTTFIHVVDLVRIDFSHYPPTITFIELKSGKVNEILLSQLKDYSLDENSLNKIENDYEIDKRYKDQARRILRQKIRISQIKKILETDSGTDIKFKMPLNLSNKELEFEFYDSILNQLCEKAVSNGLASANVGYCIHLGAGYSKDKNTAKQNAMIALEQGISNYMALTTKILTDVSNEINSLISENELYKTYNPFLSNLKSVGCRPFVLWEINRDHLMSLVTEKMCIFASFDITSFIWIGRKIGFEIGLTGRKEITPYLQKFGSHSIPTWSNRGIIYKGKKGKVVILLRLFQRIICDLVNPAIYLRQIYKINFP